MSVTTIDFLLSPFAQTVLIKIFIEITTVP